MNLKDLWKNLKENLFPVETMNLFQSVSEEIHKAQAVPVEELKRIWAEIEPHLELLGERLAELEQKAEYSKKIHALNTVLSSYGWFIPPSCNEELIDRLVTMIEKNADSRVIIQAIVFHYRDRENVRPIFIKAYEHSVFTKRQSLLEEAFEAHLQGKYGLAIPILLAQSEGAFKEALAAESLFRREVWQPEVVEEAVKELPITEIVLADILRGFSDAMYNEFTTSVYTVADFEQLKKDLGYSPLPRHAVLHGIDSSYGTEENSLKALFLLDTVRAMIEICTKSVS